MGRGSRCTLTVLLLFLLPALACNDAPLVYSTGLNPAEYPIDWYDFVSEEEDLAGVQPLNLDEDQYSREWIVFYRSEAEDDDPFDEMVDAVAYRLFDFEGIGSGLLPYGLELPYDDDELDDYEHHCYHTYDEDLCPCSAESMDVLPDCGGDELVITQKCGEDTTRLFIYEWVADDLMYVGLGFFEGDSIEMENDQILVRENMPSRANLVFECVHYPCDEACQTNPFGAYTCDKCEYLFPDQEPPDDVLTSPHPEWVVLAFYYDFQRNRDLEDYFREEVWDEVNRCRGGECGCGSSPGNISRVRVTRIDIEEERSYSETENTPVPTTDLATVEVEMGCTPQGNDREVPSEKTWRVEWDDGRWWLSRE